MIFKILLGDGMGMVNYVHFILSGECRLIEHMLVRECSTYKGTRYELYDPDISDSFQPHHPRKVSDEIEGEYMNFIVNSVRYDFCKKGDFSLLIIIIIDVPFYCSGTPSR